MHRFANPRRFQRIADRILPFAAGAAIVLFALGLWLVFFQAPPDYQQGLSVRIMYVHVPAAWMALFVYGLIGAASATALIWRHPLADMAALAASPIGAAFTALALATGSLWGKPMWGTWWVWDARLTSVLVLLFLYLGHMALAEAFEDRQRGRRAAAILALVGLVNLPIIKFSVEWWNTLHQPASVMRLDGPTIHPDMLWPLAVMGLAYLAYFLVVWLTSVKSALAEAKIRALEEAAAAPAVARFEPAAEPASAEPRGSRA